MNTLNSKRKPRKFDTSAKVVVTTAAFTALVGGWNLLAQLDRAKADTVAVEAPTLPVFDAPGPVYTTLPPLELAPIPTLAPASQLLASGAAAGSISSLPAADALSTMPGIAALAPLPTMAPLASLPSLPALPAPSASVASSGAQTSGGS